jgi:transposase
MRDDGNCQVIEHLEARPLRARRGWSAEAKARLVEETLVAGANVSAIARRAGMAPSQFLVGDVKRWQRGLRSGTGRQTPVGQ